MRSRLVRSLCSPKRATHSEEKIQSTDPRVSGAADGDSRRAGGHQPVGQNAPRCCARTRRHAPEHHFEPDPIRTGRTRYVHPQLWVALARAHRERNIVEERPQDAHARRDHRGARDCAHRHRERGNDGPRSERGLHRVRPGRAPECSASTRRPSTRCASTAGSCRLRRAAATPGTGRARTGSCRLRRAASTRRPGTRCCAAGRRAPAPGPSGVQRELGRDRAVRVGWQLGHQHR